MDASTKTKENPADDTYVCPILRLDFIFQSTNQYLSRILRVFFFSLFGFILAIILHYYSAQASPVFIRIGNVCVLAQKQGHR